LDPGIQLAVEREGLSNSSSSSLDSSNSSPTPTTACWTRRAPYWTVSTAHRPPTTTRWTRPSECGTAPAACRRQRRLAGPVRRRLVEVRRLVVRVQRLAGAGDGASNPCECSLYVYDGSPTGQGACRAGRRRVVPVQRDAVPIQWRVVTFQQLVAPVGSALNLFKTTSYRSSGPS
jgi:hypothetical protein